MNRDRFLTNIRQSLQTTLLPDSQPDLPARPTLPPFQVEPLVERFIDEVTQLSGNVYRPQSEAEAFEIILGLFAEHEAKNYLAWHGEWLPFDTLNERLAAQGFTQQLFNLPPESEERQKILATLSPTPIGITGTMGALADTGSIIVQSGPGRGRLTSLLPPIHIALLKTDLLFPTLAHFLQAHPEMVSQASNLVFISGPSRTADIEGILTLGVHGPKELHILLL